MSSTVLTRTVHAPAKPQRVPVEATPTRKMRREAKRRRKYDGTVVSPHVIDLQIRSVALWPRSYR